MAFVLIGFMGAGKSTAAAELAAALGGEALDSDALLEQRLGHPVAREFELHGEQAFRALEEELVCALLSDAAPDTAIALGGGSVLSERVRAALDGHVTVLLDVDPQTAWERVQGSPDGTTRPLASRARGLRGAAREPAHAVRGTGGRDSQRPVDRRDRSDGASPARARGRARGRAGCCGRAPPRGSTRC